MIEVGSVTDKDMMELSSMEILSCQIGLEVTSYGASTIALN